MGSHGLLCPFGPFDWVEGVVGVDHALEACSRSPAPGRDGPTLRSTIAIPAEFDDAVQPFRANVLALLDASRTLAEDHERMAGADAPAMAELDAEERFKGAWGERPVGSAHDWAGVLLVAAESQLRTMCRVVVGEPSLFGPQSLARSGLEMAGRSYWLTEPGIGVERRVARYETERLYNASELRRLTGDAETATRIEKSIIETADALSLQLIRGKRHKHTHIVEERPSGSKVFRTLLLDVERHGLGHTMFSYLSAVDHGTIYGLLTAVGREGPVDDLRPTLRPMGMSAFHTNQLLGVATVGYGFAANRHAELLGWADDGWGKGFANAVRIVFELLRLNQVPPGS